MGLPDASLLNKVNERMNRFKFLERKLTKDISIIQIVLRTSEAQEVVVVWGKKRMLWIYSK